MYELYVQLAKEKERGGSDIFHSNWHLLTIPDNIAIKYTWLNIRVKNAPYQQAFLYGGAWSSRNEHSHLHVWEILCLVSP